MSKRAPTKKRGRNRVLAKGKIENCSAEEHLLNTGSWNEQFLVGFVFLDLSIYVCCFIERRFSLDNSSRLILLK